MNGWLHVMATLLPLAGTLNVAPTSPMPRSAQSIIITTKVVEMLDVREQRKGKKEGKQKRKGNREENTQENQEVNKTTAPRTKNENTQENRQGTLEES